MSKYYFSISVFSLLLLSGKAWAQDRLAIGQWAEHLPFGAGIHVTQSDDKVFYATGQALLAIDKQERSLQRVTKVEGLSNVGVELVKYNRGAKVLVIVHDNGVVDLMDDSGILTLPNIPASNIVLGEKRVNDIFMANDSIAYLAASYGVSTLNVVQGRFPNTIKTPVEVRSAVEYQGLIFAATAEGVYTADPAAGYNIDDFSNWELLAGTKGFPADYTGGPMALFNGKLYLDVNDSIFVYDGNEANYVFHADTFELKYLSADGPHLMVGFGCRNTTCVGQVFLLDENHEASRLNPDCVTVPTFAVEDQYGNIWCADRGRDFRVVEAGSGSCTKIMVNSPYSSNTYKLDARNGQVWVAAGGVNPTYSALFLTDGFFSEIGGEWKRHSLFNVPELAGISDFMDVKVHPENGKVYAAAYLDALVSFDPVTGQYEVFNETNSTLQTAIGDGTRSRVTSLAFDSENNLWMTNHNATKPLAVMLSNGEWHSFAIPCTPDVQMARVAVDGLGRKWIMSSGASVGLIVFDEGDDLNSAADDKCAILNTSNSQLPSNEITSIAVDRDGSVWVGTKLGAVVFQCDPFNGECPGSRPFVEVDGFGANLLEDQDVRAIGVDGGNRKWFGTLAGVFLMSPEGNEQIAHFTKTNSPLFDNGITDIAFDNETGEVYIGTQKGLISYRSDATGAEAFHSNVLVFPNPVREDYDGPIAIEGLAEDATVKITDVSGQLVFETEAIGGTATWTGRDYNGRRASTGVYLVFATSRSSTNPQAAVAKILLVN